MGKLYCSACYLDKQTLVASPLETQKWPRSVKNTTPDRLGQAYGFNHLKSIRVHLPSRIENHARLVFTATALNGKRHSRVQRTRDEKYTPCRCFSIKSVELEARGEGAVAFPVAMVTQFVWRLLSACTQDVPSPVLKLTAVDKAIIKQAHAQTPSAGAL